MSNISRSDADSATAEGQQSPRDQGVVDWRLTAADAPREIAQYPVEAENGHRVDNDKADCYAKTTLQGDGSWKAFIHVNPTGHVFGACCRTSFVLFDQNKTWLFEGEVATWCVGTKDGLGGPNDRQDWVVAPADWIPAVAMRNARYFGVYVSGGQKDSALTFEQVIDAARTVAVVIQVIASL